ncbi:MAG: T9SS type A sorting domain-containing protein [Bacteroidota bacterium]
MKNVYKLAMIMLIVLMSYPVICQQVVFEQKYTGINTLPPCFKYYSGYPTQLQELPDNYILLLGQGQVQDTTGLLGGKVYQEMKKLDKSGNILWTKYFLPDSVPMINTELWFNSFQVMENGNILLVGENLNDPTADLPLANVVMLDPDGEKLFDTIYRSPTVLMKPQCSAKSTNGLAIGGYRAKYGDRTAYAMKIDSNFNKEWTFELDPIYGGLYSDFRTIISNPDGSFDCYGQMRWGTSNGYSFLFVKLNSLGQMTLVKTYSDSLTFQNACAGPGFRLMVGHYSDQDLRIILMKTDENGNLIWVKKYQDTTNVMYIPQAVTVTQDNEFLITGEIDYPDPVFAGFIGSDIYLLKTDSSGNKIWDETYGTNLVADSCIWSHWECGWDVIPAMDGSYLLCASDNIDATYGPVMSVLKIKEGYTAVNERLGFPGSSTIYPNPFHSQTIVKLSCVTPLSNGILKVFDLNGKIVQTMDGLMSETIVLCRNGLPDGVYFITVEDQQKILYRGKIMVY